jgi:class 3 adenylate cyclase/tetratricopeptide (TPR) repeat protein
MDVGDWLRSLGLGQYEVAFRDAEIDAEVLPELTDADLEKLGAPLGHRKRLLKAIAGLSVPAGGSSPSAAPVSGPKADAAERRQLTVMFCDLVGSTAMSARLDPEDMRAIIAAYHQCCASLIERGGGFVAKYMGDGVLAYFGYPLAHEHDAERAVRAGLAIVEAAPKLETAAQAPLHVRVGIATGIVVVGDLLGSGEAQERGVVGDTPNLAGRLQGIAQPDSVIIAEGTRRLLGDLFEIVDLGPQDLKGVTGPTRAYGALRESSQESRFEALHAGGLTTLVGREEETDLLLRRWTKAKAGDGQVVLVSGEAGIGKSRLTAALLERLSGEPHTRMRYFCSPQHTDSALYPIIGHMERAAGLAREDDAKAKLDKLDALLVTSAASRDDAALLADMLSVPNDGRYPALELAPQQRRQKTMEALIRQIEAIGYRTPVLMIFEDAHWTDPSSLEVLNLLVNKIDALSVLLFVAFRPEFSAPWVGRPHVTALTINRLAPREAMALIGQVAGRPLAVNIQQDIIERADGIPLFVEEITKAVLEAEGEDAAARTVAAVPSPRLAVPASLHASLMARLDRLGSAKGVAQIGAAIGRELSHTLLAFVTGLTEPELAIALDRLLHCGLLFRQGLPPNATYLFKHALVQDAAYGTLLREPRRALHARIADAIETQFPDLAENQPELVARHCTEAGLIEKAAYLWGKAGQRSTERSALREAEAQLARALAHFSTLPGTSALRRQQVTLQVALANVQMHTKGYGAPETKASLEQARELAATIEDAAERNPVYYGLWVGSYIRGELAPMRENAMAFLSSVAGRQAQPEDVSAFRAFGLTCWVEGDFTGAKEHLERAVELSSADRDRGLALRFGQEPGISAMLNLALALAPLGEISRAHGLLDQAESEAGNDRHIPTIAYTQGQTCIVESVFHDAERTRRHARMLDTLSRAHNLQLWTPVAAFFDQWTRWSLGDRTIQLDVMRASVDVFHKSFQPIFQLGAVLLAESKQTVDKLAPDWPEFGSCFPRSTGQGSVGSLPKRIGRTAISYVGVTRRTRPKPLSSER